MDKDAIRAEARDRRRGLDPAQAAAHSARICTRICQLPEWLGATAVLSYVPAKENEADVWPLVRGRLAESRPVFVPVTGPGHQLRWSRIEGWQELAPGRYGIPEPREDCLRFEPIPEGAVCLVPGVAFAPDGARIGFGRGYFDRFLASFDGLSIGVAFETQLYPALPREEHDVPVQVVVTESAVYRP